MAKKYINKSKLLGKIGTENYKVSNCPVHLPKENVGFFMAMQNAGNEEPFSSDIYSNLITPSWKKSIYESVMNTVSKEVKKVLNESFDFNSNNTLNEGAWGYEPDQSDSTLDEIGNLYDDLTEVVYDKCKKLLAKRSAYDNFAWDVIAIIEHYFEKMPLLNTINDNKSLYWKYYCWWRLKETKNKDILELYEQAIKKCETDQKWLNTWDNPEEMQASLQKRRNLLNRFLKIQMKSEMNEGFMFEGECGGMDGCYANPMNTVGVGNVVPAGIPGMTGAQLADDSQLGSGDIATGFKKKSKKKSEKTLYFPIATKK